MYAAIWLIPRTGSLQYFLKLLKWSGRWCSAETKPATPESATLLHREQNISKGPKMPLRNRSKSLPKVIAARPEAAGATSASCQLGVLRLWRDVKLMDWCACYMLQWYIRTIHPSTRHVFGDGRRAISAHLHNELRPIA